MLDEIDNLRIKRISEQVDLSEDLVSFIYYFYLRKRKFRFKEFISFLQKNKNKKIEKIIENLH